MPAGGDAISDSASDDNDDPSRPEVQLTDYDGYVYKQRTSLSASSASSSSGTRLRETAWNADADACGRRATIQSGTTTSVAHMYRRRVSRTFPVLTLSATATNAGRSGRIPPRRRCRVIFQTVYRLTVIYIRVRNSIMRGREYRKQLDHVQYALSAAEAAESAAMFDPSEFKAKRQMRTTAEVKRILQKPPLERTENEVYYVGRATIALRGLKLISDYPIKMQQNLALYGYFESYGPGRVIIKERHRPDAFYFILYGSVIVAVFNDVTNESDTKCILQRDESFGELAIMNQSARQSTIITKDYTEFLSIDSRTYEKTFMVGGRRLVSDPGYRRLLESLTFLRDWPTNLLLTTCDPKLLVFAYFKRGSVMMRDSNYSDWIYIVKSGSVDVMKKLVRPKDNSTAVKAFSTGGSGNSCWVDCTKRPPRSRQISRPQTVQDKLIAFQDNQVASRVGSFRTKQAVGNESTSFTMMDAQQLNNDDPTSRSLKPSSASLGGRAAETAAGQTKTTAANDQRRLKLRAQSAGVVGNRSRSPTAVALPVHRYDHQQSPTEVAVVTKLARTPQSAVAGARVRSVQWDQSHSQQAERKQGNYRPPRMNSGRRRVSTVQAEQAAVAGAIYAEKRTFIDDLDKRGKDKANDVLTEADRNPAFIHIQTLTKADVFGLTAMVFPNQPSLCLISNGAECIMINKHFYTSHCSEEKLFKLQMEVSPYPSDEKMQSDLIAHINWESYKVALVKSIASRRRRTNIVG